MLLRSKKKIGRWMTVAAISVLVVLRLYHQFVPWGAPFFPWKFGRVDGPELKSPDGRRTVRVYFNDGGAAHSGNHWTWVVEESWSAGRRVVAEGYLGPEVAVRGGPVPIEWGPENQVNIQFLAVRHGTE
jgi:hypothetical protein